MDFPVTLLPLPVDHQAYMVGESAMILQGDSLRLLELLPDNSVDLVVIDPPYFKIKDAPWDHQWDTPDGFLDWIRQLCRQYVRVLRPNGSIYVFASSRMASRVEAVIAEFFNVLNHIVWVKTDENGNGRFSRVDTDQLRAFFTQTERVIFAEHYNADNIVKGVPGYGARLDEARGFLFEPLRAYLAGEIARAGFTSPQIERLMGNHMGRHWFTTSQWELPTRKNYAKLQDLLQERGRKPAPMYEQFHPAGGLWEKYGLGSRATSTDRDGAAYEYMAADYNYLRADYEALKTEYDRLKAEFVSLRRPFSIQEEAPYTDVWGFHTVNGYAGKHPCEKPVNMLQHIIECSSTPGSVVLDSFLGSGVTGAVAKQLGRFFIGMELDEQWVHTARARIGDASAILDIPRAAPAVWSVAKSKPTTSTDQLSVFDLLSVDGE